MAVDAQIDSLRIEIETNITSDPQKIDAIYESLSRLKSITEEKWSGLDEVVNKINKLSALNQISLSNFNSSLQSISNNLSPIQNMSLALEGNQSSLTNYNNKIEQVAATTYRAGKQTSTFNNQLKNLTPQVDYAGKSAERGSSAFDKLVLSIKRITFYRVVRRAIQLIGKEIVEAINNFVQFDETTNESISGLMSSWKAMSNAFGVAFSQLINTAAPVLIQILDLATEVANTISLVFATISGEEFYSKAIKYQTDYAEAIEETNKQLLGFDKFNVLSGQPAVSPFEMFETEEVATGWANISDETLLLISALETLIAIKLAGWISEVVNGLGGFVKGLSTAEMGTKALTAASGLLRTAGIFLLIFAINELVTNWDNLSNGMRAFYILLGVVGAALIVFSNQTLLTTLVKALTGAQVSVGSLAATFGLLLLAIGAVLAAVYIFSNWDSFNEGTKRTITIISTLIVVLVAAAIAAMALMQTLTLGTTIGLIIAGIAAGAVAIKGFVSAAQGQFSFFANGGIPDTRGGSMFVMNEGGNPELIHENGRGQVQISNQESLRGAFLDALRQHDMDTQGNGQSVEVVVRFDTDGNALIRALRPYMRNENVRAGQV